MYFDFEALLSAMFVVAATTQPLGGADVTRFAQARVMSVLCLLTFFAATTFTEKRSSSVGHGCMMDLGL